MRTEVNNFSEKFSIVGLFVMAVLFTLHIASDFFIPIVMALLMYLVLRPVLRLLARAGLPAPAAASIILLVTTGMIVTAVAYLAEPVDNWFRDLPGIAYELQHKVALLREPMETVTEASERVREIAKVEGGGEKSDEVVIKEPSLIEQVASTLPVIGVQVLSTLFLLFFFLSYSNEMVQRLLHVLSPNHQADLRTLLNNIERNLSRYLATITLINAGLGIVIGAGMYAIGMPTPYLWGVLAAVLNFVPYLGSLAGMVIVALVGLLSFNDPLYALSAPLVYFVCNGLEGQVITPAILGRRLLVSPMVIFLAVAFWAWLWGPLGGLLAVPMMIVMKMVADSVPSLQAVGHVIGRSPPD